MENLKSMILCKKCRRDGKEIKLGVIYAIVIVIAKRIRIEREVDK